MAYSSRAFSNNLMAGSKRQKAKEASRRAKNKRRKVHHGELQVKLALFN